MSTMLNCRYTPVSDFKSLRDTLLAVWDSAIVGLAIQTTGPDHRRDSVRLLSLATDSGTFVLDLFAIPSEDCDSLFDALACKEVCGHDLLFDLSFLLRLGFDPGRVFDTALASQVLDNGDRTLNHSLAEVVERHLGAAVDGSSQAANWRGEVSVEMIRYAALRAELPVWLRSAMEPMIEVADLAATVEVENRALPSIVRAAAHGVGIDSAGWHRLAEEAITTREELERQLDELVPGNPNSYESNERNWNSPAEVKEAFSTLGIFLESTDGDTLAGIDHPLASLVKQYRTAANLVGTYGVDWIKNHVRDGRVYPTWRQIGATSGRMSSIEPNLQGVPGEAQYRACFTARPGHVLVKADYSQIDLRIAARRANELKMIEAFVRGDDLHALTARALTGKTEVEKSDRDVAKAINFGLLYGMGWRRLMAKAKSDYGVTLSETEAKEYRSAFFKTYTAIAEWHQSVKSDLDRMVRSDPNRTHETRTLGGRRRILPVARWDRNGSPYPNVTEFLNAPIQGTGADGIKAALALLWERRGICPSAIPFLFVHDEIVVECPEVDAERARDWLVRCMRDGMSPLIDPVPVVVDAKIVPTWGG